MYKKSYREEAGSLQNLSKTTVGYEKELRMQFQPEMGRVMQTCVLS